MVQNPIRATQFSASGTLCPQGSLYDQLGFVTQGKAQCGTKCGKPLTERLGRSRSSYGVLKENEKTKKRLYSVNTVDEPVGIGGAVEGCDSCQKL